MARLIATEEIVRSLEAAAKLVHSGEGRLGFALKHSDCESGRNLENLTSSEIFDSKTMRELASNHCQLEYIVQFTKALSDSASELLDRMGRYLDPYYAKLSKGFGSLPNELLGLIFKFRRIALSDQHLWSYLFFRHDTNLDRVLRYMDRCSDHTDVHVVIKDGETTSDIDYIIGIFFKKCMSVASRLRTISLFGNWNEFWVTTNVGNTLGYTLEQLIQHPLSSTHLHQLNLTSDFYYEPGNRRHRYWLSMNTSPPRSFPFKAITSFFLELTFIGRDNFSRQMEDLYVFLSSMPNLSEINLDFINELDADRCRDGPKLVETLLPAVSSFRIYVKDSSVPLIEDWVLTSFMKHLRMPVLERLDVHFKWRHLSTVNSPPMLRAQISEFVCALTPHPTFHQRLKHYTVKLSLPFEDSTGLVSKLREKKVSFELKIHANRTPFVTVLEVTTYGSVQFFLSDEEEAAIQPIQLREVRLIACDNMVQDDLHDMIHSLDAIGAGDALERVVVQNCDFLDDSMAETVMQTRRKSRTG
ncbi:hypothetical protein SCHPADRAFT_1002183 [Schizopora paradoxa]|uniref:Uncharacterized protein n=1 Tax=Schizopora paradoxa TaxID=27342 RepID=A0A0H2R5U0_9AGAM|nr:hypothetical protein SCHPADRAFT_1002183 [Schizopora paradoxa]